MHAEGVCSLKATEFSPTSYDQKMDSIVFFSLWKRLVKVESYKVSENRATVIRINDKKCSERHLSSE